MNKNVQYIMKLFKRYPARMKVASCMLDHGLRIDNKGNVLCGDIEISPVKLARYLKVDRRVVSETAKFILSIKHLKNLFTKIKPMARLDEVGRELGLGIVRIYVRNAKEAGIIYRVTEILAKSNISIRQLIAEDVGLEYKPSLTLVLEGDISGNIVFQLKNLGFVEKVEII